MNRITIWLALTVAAAINIAAPLHATEGDNTSLALNLIYQRTLPSIVSITVVDHNGQTRRGSGFFVDERGLFVTGFSNVQDAQRITIRTHNGWLYNVTEVIAIDKDHDLALLRAPASETRVLNLIPPTARLVPGYPAITIGSGLGLTWHIASGALVPQTNAAAAPPRGKSGLIAFKAAVEPGNQGGPLVNQYGQVLGVIQAPPSPGESTHWAVHANHVRDLINKINALPLSATWVTVPQPAPPPPKLAALPSEKATGPDDEPGSQDASTETVTVAEQPASAAKLETAALREQSEQDKDQAPEPGTAVEENQTMPPKYAEHIDQVKRVAWATISTAADPARVCPPMISEHLSREFGIQTVPNGPTAQARMHLGGKLDTGKECNMWGCFDGYRLHMSFSIINPQGKTLFTDVFEVDEDDVEEACEELAEDIVDEVEDFL